MSNARQAAKYDDLRTLQSAGWTIHTQRNHIATNDGSESDEHLLYKLAALQTLTDAGYRVASEVEHDDRGEIDILGYGHPDREIVAIEIERGADQDTIDDKLERYVNGTPISECFVVDPFEVSQGYAVEEIGRAKTQLREETGL